GADASGSPSPTLAEALIRSRSALSGPFQGAMLPINLPTPLDNPERLSHWDVTPRLQVCGLEVLSGLHFNVDQSAKEMTLEFVNVTRKPLSNIKLVSLVRPDTDIFKQQLQLVANYAHLREDRGAEILTQVPNQVAFWGSVIGLTSHRHKWTMELVTLMLALAGDVEMRFKHAFACPRPVDLSPQIQPMIPTPGHASWPSGHATEAFTVITVLLALLPAGHQYKEQLQRLAARIAVNRTVAGVHYPVDSAAGRLLGTALGEFFVSRCQGAKNVALWGFDGRKFEGKKAEPVDFDLRVSMTDNLSGYYQHKTTKHVIHKSPLLEFMWTKAAKEWQPLK
ncbi:MAG: phosphatase PAP2 family protein, partial [Polaromonas sp.]|uniref:phosphatase PAP2 family protein n=1 Tax=Polaromonas sp. TaxID=1869339 RepID=UPI002487B63C